MDSTGGGDTSTTADGTESTTEARSGCNLGPTPADEIVFGEPVALPGVNSAVSEENGWLSSDELTLWLTTIRPEGVGGYDVFRTTRASTDAAFGPLAALNTINTAFNEERPVLTSDGLTLYCASNNAASTGSFDVMVATRESTLIDFGPLAPVANVNSVDSDAAPHISADGSELYFHSNRAGSSDIFRAELGNDGSFGPATPVGELNDRTTSEGDPVLSADGLTIFFSSNREGQFDVYVATRSTRNDGFGDAVGVSGLNTADLDWPVWLSADGCRILIASSRQGEGGYDLWIAEREI